VAGTIEDHETAIDAVIREVLEETGITSVELYSTMECEQYYRPDLNCISILPVFVGFIPENQTVTLNEEHSEFRWVSFDDAGEMLSLPVQRRMLLSIQREFIERQPSSLLLVKSES
jgi:dATP pyrophosphohydrolase